MKYADRDRIEGHIQEQAEARSLYAAKSEAEVIGAALALPGDCEELFDRLDPVMFGDSVLGAVWGAIAERQRAGRSMAPDLIAEDLAKDDDFAQRGGAGWLDDLRRTASIFGLFEHAEIIIDRAGRRAVDRLVQDAAASVAKGASPAELIETLERDLLQIRLQGAERAPAFTTAGEAAERVLEALDAPERAGGITTGLAPLDEQLGPLQPGDLILLMGRPSMGKSAAAECIALNMARQGAGVAQLNGEMTKEQMARRHMTDICFDRHGWAGPKYSDIRRRAVKPEQRIMLGEAAADLKPLPLLMAKRPGLKLSQLRSMIRRQVALWSNKGVPLGAVIVDHVGLLKSDSKRADRYEAQTEVSNGLKELADELQCVIIGLNQMNRENEKRDDKRPQLSDLRDSGSWEQDADFVVGFYREAYYAQRTPEPKKQEEIAEWLRAKGSRNIEAIVLKAREGECGTATLWGDVARNAIRGEPPSDDGWGLL